jgi:uncharacterized protein YndB with AHSA1/START domain
VKVEPPTFVSFRWARAMGAVPPEGDSTLVEFTPQARTQERSSRASPSGPVSPSRRCRPNARTGTLLGLWGAEFGFG